MRVAFLMPGMTIAGGVRRIVDLSNHLVERGHAVTIYHPKGTPCEWLPCQARIEPTAKAPGVECDVVVFCESFPETHELALQVAARQRIFYVLGMEPAAVVRGDSERSRRFTRILHDRAIDQVWVVATWMQSWLRENADCSPEVLFAGVNRAIFHPVRGAKQYEKPVILHSGDPRKRKGAATVEKALEYVRAELGEVEARTYSKKGYPQSEMARIYASANVLACGELGYGWTNVVLEAMACGTPVACTDQGGVHDFAFHEKTALLSPVGDATGLAANIVRLWREPALAADLAKEAYNHSMNFDWEATAARFEALVESGLGVRQGRHEAVVQALTVPGKTRADELGFLYDLCGQAPAGIAVDLGTYYGRSAALFGLAGRQVITIDDYREGRDAQAPKAGEKRPAERGIGEAMARLGLSGRVRVVAGLTERIPKGLAGPVAVLFVDGGHTRAQLEKDLATWLPLVRDGGIVAFHDYRSPRWPEVKPTVDAAMAQGWQMIGREGKIVAYRRMDG